MKARFSFFAQRPPILLARLPLSPRGGRSPRASRLPAVAPQQAMWYRFLRSIHNPIFWPFSSNRVRQSGGKNCVLCWSQCRLFDCFSTEKNVQLTNFGDQLGKIHHTMLEIVHFCQPHIFTLSFFSPGKQSAHTYYQLLLYIFFHVVNYYNFCVD